jgi:glutamyl-Q tRNA(Asp) synthetase
VGRFAPSPSGPLHAGSLVAALASFLDARAQRGQWRVRIEDLDTPRTVAGAADLILQQLSTLGMRWDREVTYQSRRLGLYQQAFATLLAAKQVYACGCTRREIADSVLSQAEASAHSERPYAGTCRSGAPVGRQAYSWRLRVPEGTVCFTDRWLGLQQQDVARVVGDFVLKRVDGIWSYQLAVVVDDAQQGVTDIVRGEDLLSSTARQRLLARLLGLNAPSVLHVPVIYDARGLKLSKQNGAQAIDLSNPLGVLQQGWQALGFEKLAASNIETFWSLATQIWGQGPERANLHGIHHHSDGAR